MIYSMELEPERRISLRLLKLLEWANLKATHAYSKDPEQMHLLSASTTTKIAAPIL